MEKLTIEKQTIEKQIYAIGDRVEKLCAVCQEERGPALRVLNVEPAVLFPTAPSSRAVVQSP